MSTAVVEFRIPVSSRDELLKSSKKQGQYVVRDVLDDSDEIHHKLTECSQFMKTNGPHAIQEYFDCFYSVCENFVKIDKSVREESWKMTTNALSVLCDEISDFLDCGTSHEKKMMNTTLKMWTYVAYQLIGGVEHEASKSEGLSGATGKAKGRRKKATTGAGEGGLDWAAEKENVLRLLASLLDLDLHLLWDPPSVAIMDSYSNLVASCCYKVMENPGAMKEKSLKEGMFQVLGLLVQKYNQMLSVSIKVVQLLQHFEHLVMPTALMLEYFVTKLQMKAPTAEVVREIGRKDPGDLSLDAGGTRQFASFLAEVAQRVPEAVYPSVSCLLPHLGYESYTMRNGVLGVLGEVLIQVLHPQKMNDEALKNVRDQCLDRLEDHIHDVNAFVRSKCLHIWQQLVLAKVIPVGRFDVLLDRVKGRLHDKSSMVRKSVVQFLTTCLEGNPYASELVEEQFSAKLEEAEKELKSLLPEDWVPSTTGSEEEKSPNEGDEVEEGPPLLDKEHKLLSDNENAEKIAQLTLVVKYLRDALSFTRLMSDCIPTVSQLLGSKSTSDVMEALEFLCTAQEFHLPRASAGMRRALVLIWSSDGQVKEMLLSHYTRLYLTTEEDSPRKRHEVMCRNLIDLSQGLNTGEQASLEELIVLMVKKETIPQPVLKLMWEVFAGKCFSPSLKDSHGALVILTMAGGADNELLKNNFDLLVKRGLGSGDLRLARQTCIALQKMVSVKKRKGDISDPPFRLPMDHALFARLLRLTCEGISDVSHCLWTPFAEQAVAALYRLVEHPDQLARTLLQKLAGVIFRPTASGNSQGHVQELDGDFSPVSTSTQDTECDTGVVGDDPGFLGNSCNELNSLVLSRFIGVLGCVAHQQLIHLEQYTLGELKRRARLREARSKKDSDTILPTPALGKTPKGRTPGTMHTAVASGDGNNEEEMLGAAEDVEAELVHRVCEQELLHPVSSLLGSFLPLIVTVCQDPQVFSCPVLQTSAALALAKFMLISSKFCDQNLQLLFTILEKSPQPVIRANTIVALGDLTFRFPNLIEPWTSHLYARLSDESVLVRKNTMTVLSHLVLNDMVKVKGQISFIALCLEDSEPHIADLAKLFFHELAKKGNALYNILPDIISRLSDPVMAVSEDTFNTILKYLLSFIQKEKQSEMLVEKLCHRFRATRSERQWRDIAHCLAQLSYSERAVKKLQENLPCYQDKLGGTRVYTYFSAIFSKCRKFAKPEIKTLVDELEGKVEEMHKKYAAGEGETRCTDGADGERDGSLRQPSHQGPLVAMENVPKGRGSSMKAISSHPKSARSVRSRRAAITSEESEEEDYVPQTAKKTSLRSKRTLTKLTKSTKTSKVKGNKLLFSSEEDDPSCESSLEMEPQRIFSDETSDVENVDPLCMP